MSEVNRDVTDHATIASIVCPTSVFRAWSLLCASVASSHSAWRNWQANTEQATFACRQAKLAGMQNVLAKHEMFENFGGGEMSKQGQAVETHVRQTMLVSFARPLLLCILFELYCNKKKENIQILGYK